LLWQPVTTGQCIHIRKLSFLAGPRIGLKYGRWLFPLVLFSGNCKFALKTHSSYNSWNINVNNQVHGPQGLGKAMQIYYNNHFMDKVKNAKALYK
jgi:hypothetical protein